LGVRNRFDGLKAWIEAFQKERRLTLEAEAWRILLEKKRRSEQVKGRVRARLPDHRRTCLNDAPEKE